MKECREIAEKEIVRITLNSNALCVNIKDCLRKMKHIY